LEKYQDIFEKYQDIFEKHQDIFEKHQDILKRCQYIFEKMSGLLWKENRSSFSTANRRRNRGYGVGADPV
jgi:hypothetical protein